MTYFAGRASPMGAVGASIVATDAPSPPRMPRSRGPTTTSARGLIDADRSLTDAGRELRREIGATTDRAVLGPWARLGASRCEALHELVAPLAAAVAHSRAIPVLNPTGLPSD